MIKIKLRINHGYNILPSFSSQVLVNLRIASFRYHHHDRNITLVMWMCVLLQLYTSPRDVTSGSQLDISDKHLKAMLANKDREIISLKKQLEVSNIMTYALQ
jgi:hypothetical protein